MDRLKINEKGQITIPKSIREKYGLTSGITLTVTDNDGRLTIEPTSFCYSCKKALPNGTCPNCPPPKTIYLY